MNGNNNFGAIGVAVGTSMSASRGILALQGIGLSSVSVCGFGTPATTSPALRPIHTLLQDKPNGGWHPTANAAVGVFAREAGYEPAAEPMADIDLQAARLRTAHPATVIRNRHRCRPR
ncbi:hypothetical protein ACFYT3_10085 [Nocardia amikacinitolerans]|uniref:Uncharacterized protein n=1 Tax=Nocardia amikacinitolerans TaxID=756689 RepID=A0A285L6B5_9NOCA|nr:hypothetical protein [Nocardia amikacinitolerans]MCP2274710.1 hypothetical protein [Nocardia amikacinitolerans]MCP2289954.1 hypothetical protein [Nocardia amikacinitolerans]MCP2296539.1 hypothetical protein [Nocardia amikacinitolerans]MCP2320525.1 hypothetical protein [Nocardia amikacinitolerans]SNY80495.1 hypothetical protein SAMN04244553_2065 [Nocardia amikacinitolerans]